MCNWIVDEDDDLDLLSLNSLFRDSRSGLADILMLRLLPELSRLPH